MSDGTGDLKLDYVDFPVYAKVQVPTPGVSPFGYLGPQVWFEVTCKVDDVRCTGGDRSKFSAGSSSSCRRHRGAIVLCQGAGT
jgi:hypothetical protein